MHVLPVRRDDDEHDERDREADPGRGGRPRRRRAPASGRSRPARRRRTTARRRRRPAARCAWAAGSRARRSLRTGRPTSRRLAASVSDSTRCMLAVPARRCDGADGTAPGRAASDTPQAAGHVDRDTRALRDHGLWPGRLDPGAHPRGPATPSPSSTRTRTPSAGSAPASRAAGSPGSASTGTRCCEAGIEEAYAFAAVSSGDNSNILAARVARETFGVDERRRPDLRPRPRRGLPAARASPRWRPCAGRRTRCCAGCCPAGADARVPGPRGTRRRSPRCRVHLGWVGPADETHRGGRGGRVAYLTRLGEGIVPDAGHRATRRATCVHIVPREDRGARRPPRRSLAAPPAEEQH